MADVIKEDYGGGRSSDGREDNQGSAQSSGQTHDWVHGDGDRQTDRDRKSVV